MPNDSPVTKFKLMKVFISKNGVCIDLKDTIGLSR